MEAIGRLAGGVAHDFNNLLMAIMGYGEIIRSSLVKDDPLYKYSDDILKASERAASFDPTVAGLQPPAGDADPRCSTSTGWWPT